MKTGLQNSKKEMDIRQVHKGFSSFIEKYLPYLKFFQSGAIQYFYWLQSPKCLILGTHYAYSNRVGLDKRLHTMGIFEAEKRINKEGWNSKNQRKTD